MSLAAGPQPKPAEPASAQFVAQDDRVLDRIAQSLALVNFDMPFTISGVGERHYYGTGVVVDAAQGLVAVDRNTVPEAMGDVRITFAGSVEIAAAVEFVHPLHNLVMLRYNPADIGDTPVRSIAFGKGVPKPGAELLAAGLRSDSRVVSQQVRVASVDPVGFPLSRTMRFRDTNLETITLVTSPRGFDGVLTDKRGKAVALWSSFAYESGGEMRQSNKGVPINVVQEMLDIVRGDGVLYSLEVEFRQMPLSVARNFGLPDEWATRLESQDPDRRQLLAITRLVAGTPAAQSLQPGDLLLSVDDTPVTRFGDVQRLTQKDSVQVKIWRNSSELEFAIPTVALNGHGVRRALNWSGALLQAPYRQMAAQRGIEPVGVYVAYFSYGSPASRSGLTAGSRIVEVDGQPVTDLDEFIAQVRNRQDRESVRLTTKAWNGLEQVLTLKIDQLYWPTWEILYNGDWHRVALDPD